jgi:hypothetical protein
VLEFVELLVEVLEFDGFEEVVFVVLLFLVELVVAEELDIVTLDKEVLVIVGFAAPILGKLLLLLALFVPLILLEEEFTEFGPLLPLTPILAGGYVYPNST